MGMKFLPLSHCRAVALARETTQRREFSTGNSGGGGDDRREAIMGIEVMP